MLTCRKRKVNEKKHDWEIWIECVHIKVTKERKIDFYWFTNEECKKTNLSWADKKLNSIKKIVY